MGPLPGWFRAGASLWPVSERRGIVISLPAKASCQQVKPSASILLLLWSWDLEILFVRF